MGLIFIRTIIIYVTLLVVMRLMGKRQIGEMQPFELVVTLLIAELACIPMADTSIPLLYGVVAIVAIFFLHQIVCLLDLGKQLKKNNLDVSDLIESLRAAGYFSLDAVDYALYEANGSFSALPKSGYEEMQTSLPVILIDEGKFDKENLRLTGRDKSYFLDILRKQGCKSEKKVLVMTVDGNGKAYFQRKGEKYKVLELGWEEKIW